MPTLDWLDRERAITAADRVSYRVLEPVSSYGDGNPENLLIQGDNLDALKALLPFYRGKVEYKGGHLRNDPYEIEKRQVGELWAARSAGRCRFRFVYLDEAGQSMSRQIDETFRDARPQ